MDQELKDKTYYCSTIKRYYEILSHFSHSFFKNALFMGVK